MSRGPDDLFPTPDDPLAQVVRAHIDAEADEVEVDRLLRDLRTRLEADPPISAGASASSGRRWSWVALPLVVSAGLLLAFVLFASVRRSGIHPGDSVAQARDTYAGAVDRRYALRTELAPEAAAPLAHLNLAGGVVLWTRGDRYWAMLTPGGQGAWGLDEEGYVWLAPTPEAAARFGPDEVPDLLREFQALRAVHLGKLLDHALERCYLDWTQGAGLLWPTNRVRVIPREGEEVGRLRHAVLEVDNGVVRWLTVERRVFGTHVATVTMELIENGTQPDDAYRARGHLRAGAPVYEEDQARERQAVLRQAQLQR